ncbi:MAG: metalloregulator ArsR/SmtB family transcription factor [Subtercola sp.]|nr:metalloregulator ArsR/SmtB family transcription factor [Subtercola sp.]
MLSLLLERYVAADEGVHDAAASAGEGGDEAVDATGAGLSSASASEAAGGALVSETPVSGAPMGEVSVSELVALLELSQPTVSKHLKVLRDAGLVSVREVGQHRYYALESSPLEEVEDWLIPFLSADFDEMTEEDGIDFEDELDELTALAESSGNSASDSPREKSPAAKAGERAGQTAAAAAERARSLFGGAGRRFPTISRSSD